GQQPQQQSRRRAPQPQQEAPAPRQPQRPARSEEPRRVPSPRRGRQPAAEEDPGLVLISRRPPKQKYANFEEYIAAHGGVTAPLPGEDAPAGNSEPSGKPAEK